MSIGAAAVGQKGISQDKAMLNSEEIKPIAFSGYRVTLV